MAAPSFSPSQAFRLGLFGNAVLAVLKLAVGWMAGSPALAADGWHSVADVAVNGAIWGAHVAARRGPDDDHHYGHGKLEAFAGLVVGLGLLVGGVLVAWEGVTEDVEPNLDWRGVAALGVAVASIAVNLGLAWVAARAARSTSSAGLTALVRDNGSDALAGLLVVVALLGSRAGLAWPEPLAAVAIGGLIVVLGWRTTKEGFDVLTDRVPDRGLRRRVMDLAREVDGVRGVQSVRVHPVGNGLRIDLEISVDGRSSVAEGHTTAHRVESRIKGSESDVREVHVHVNPAATAPDGS